MQNSSRMRQVYTRFFLSAALLIALYAMTQSIAGGILHLDVHFWGRSSLINAFNTLRMTAGDRVFSKALIGKDGWLEYTEDGDLDVYQASATGSSALFKTRQEKLQKLYDELQKRHITLILVIAPNKSSIYADTLPDEIQQKTGISPLEAFTTYMKEHGPPIVVDLRQPLKNGRKQQDVYYKTDTHWNAYGAFIAYSEIMQKLAESDPRLAPLPLKAFRITTSKPTLHDIPRFIGLTSPLEADILFHAKEKDVQWTTLNDDPVIPMQIATTSKTTAPTLLMYMDSFGISTRNFIAPHFSKSTFILNHSKYPNTVSMEMIDATKPDVVIVEFVERFFHIKKLDAFLNKLIREKP